MKSTIRRVLWFTALATGGGAASALTIDDFDQGPLFLQVSNLTGQTVVQNGLDPSHVIGGARSTYAGSLSNATLQITTPANAGQFSFSADSSWGYFTLLYGSAAPLGANLLADGSDRFVMNISSLTPGLYRGIFGFKVESGDKWFTYYFGNDLFNLNGPGILTIPFSRFAGADLTQVQQILIDVGRFEPSFQIRLDSITTVPEPSPLALLALALLAPILSFRLKERNPAPL